jgi:8-oxo-dGTP pyrophosphatase MutT (NUDIX family)
MIKPWSRLSSELEQRYRIFDLRREKHLSPRTGEPFATVVLESDDWVNVVALTSTQHVILVRQFRFGSGHVTLEIPGGIVDPGEAPLEAAQRELREETGYAAQRWASLGSIAPNPAIHRNRLHTFLAEGCELVASQEQDPGEDIAVELRALADIDRMLAANELDHALVAVAFHKLALLRAGHTLDSKS